MNIQRLLIQVNSLHNLFQALDTSERDRALKDLEKEREARRRVDMEGAQLRLQYQIMVEENNNLKLELETLRGQLRNSG